MKKTVLASVSALAVVIFSVQNAANVNVSFLFWHFRCSMALLIIIMLVAGITAGILVSGSALRKKSSALKSAEKRLNRLERKMAEQANANRNAT